MTIKIFTLLSLLFLCSNVHATTYYISPTGNDLASGAIDAPWKTFQKSFNSMSAGDTLYLYDGTYSTATAVATGYIAGNAYAGYNYEVTNSSQPPSGTSISNMTKVYALNQGRAIVQGGLILGDSANKKSFIDLRGIIFYPMGSSQLIANGGTLINTSYNTIKNCAFISIHGDSGCMALGIGSADHNKGNSYNLVEDCFLYSKHGRGASMNYRSCYNVWRRITIRDDGGADSGRNGSGNPCIAFSVYNSSCVSVQNMIIVDRNYDATNYDYGDFATANHSMGEGADIYNNDNEWLGCMSINSEGPGYTFEADYSQNSTYKLQNCLSCGSSIGMNFSLTSLNSALDNLTSINSTTGPNIRYYGDHGMVYGWMRNVVALNSGSYSITSGTKPVNACVYGDTSGKYNVESCTVGELTTDPTSDGTPASLKYPVRIETGSALKGTGYGGADYGANIIYRYGVDGTRYGDENYNTLTETELWPFPNEAITKHYYSTINDDYGFSCSTYTQINGNDETLTSYIWEYLGNGIPDTIYNSTSTVTANDTSVNEGDTVSFTLGITSGTFAQGYVDYGDGTYETITSTDSAVTHTYVTAGTYRASWAADSTAGATNPQTVAITVSATEPKDSPSATTINGPLTLSGQGTLK